MTVLGTLTGVLSVSAGLFACGGQPPARDGGSPLGDASAGGPGRLNGSVAAGASAGTSSAAAGSGGASGNDAAASSSGGGVAREPEVPLLPYPAEAFDPEALRALRQRLSRLAARVAPRARPAGEEIAAKLTSGQRVERSYTVAKGCYTAVGLAEAGGIVDLGLELVNQASSDQVLADAGKGDTAVVGEPPACLRISASSELRLVLTAISGAGLATAQLYGR
jgi:hypothetical protein